MPRVETSFSASDPVGSTTDLLLVKRNESLRCFVGGVFVAVVVLEYTHNGGATWVIQDTVTESLDINVIAITSASEKAYYRMRLVEYTSGTAEVILEDVADDIPETTINDNKGQPLMRFKDGLAIIDGNMNLNNLIIGGHFITTDKIYVSPGDPSEDENDREEGVVISSSAQVQDESSVGHINISSTLASMKFDSETNVFTFDKGTNIKGGHQVKTTVVTQTAYSILKTDFAIFANTSSNNTVLTLPTIVSGDADDGRIFRIQKAIDSDNSLTIKSQSPSQINTEDTDIVMGIKNDNATFMALGGNWYVISRDTTALGALELTTPGATQGLNLTPSRLSVFDTERFSTPGVCEADQANDIVKVEHVESVNVGGDGYRLDFRLEISGYSNNQEIGAEIFVGGVATDIQTVEKTSVQLNTVLEAGGVYQIPGSPKDVEIKIFASNTETATFETAQLVVERLVK